MLSRVAVLLALVCGCTSHPPAAASAADDEPTAITVRVVGHGRPMILIPGLACPGEVWRGAEQRLADHWQLHIVTVAGFAGVPPTGQPPLLDHVRAAIVHYIEEHRLVAPVIVGHSLGGMLAFWVAATAPGEVGPVIALEGVPYGPGLADAAATPDAMRPRAEALRARVSRITDAQEPAQARLMFTPMFSHPDDLEWVLRYVVRSDVKTVGEAMYELMTTDLRPQVSAITTPVLLMVAGHNFDDEKSPDLSPYEQELVGVAHHRVVVVPEARHFVMLDRPDFVYGEIRRFLGQ